MLSEPGSINGPKKGSLSLAYSESRMGREIRGPGSFVLREKSHSPDDSELDAYWRDDGESADDRSALSPRPTTPPSPPSPPRPRVASQRDVAAAGAPPGGRRSIPRLADTPTATFTRCSSSCLVAGTRRRSGRARARRSSRSRKRYLTARMTFDSTWRRANTRRRGGRSPMSLTFLIIIMPYNTI